MSDREVVSVVATVNRIDASCYAASSLRELPPAARLAQWSTCCVSPRTSFTSYLRWMTTFVNAITKLASSM
jgi:hypothetical protein